MIKINTAKFWLSFVYFAGAAVGASLYNQTLSLFDRVVDSRYAWILVPVVIGLLIYIFWKLRSEIKNDLEKLDAINKMNLRMLLNGFVTGYLLFYMILGAGGAILLIVYLVIQFFYS